MEGEINLEENCEEENPPLTQAGRILWRFGGAVRLSKILKAIGRPKNYEACYRWDYPKERGGSGGRIPGCAVDDILAAAKADGIILTDADWSPERHDLDKDSVRAFPRMIRAKGGSRWLEQKK